MARLTTSRTKRERRIGEKLWTHGEKAYGRRSYPPGQHGPKGGSRLSEYGLRLREKQKAQLTYGLLERQFRRYIVAAKRKAGDTSQVLIQLLEQRLDSVVYRAGFAQSREAARQLVRHGHVAVNGRRVDIPSYQVRVGQLVSIHPARIERPTFQELRKRLENYEAPSWILLDKAILSAKLAATPEPAEAASNIAPQLIIEFYSR